MDWWTVPSVCYSTLSVLAKMNNLWRWKINHQLPRQFPNIVFVCGLNFHMTNRQRCQVKVKLHMIYKCDVLTVKWTSVTTHSTNIWLGGVVKCKRVQFPLVPTCAVTWSWPRWAVLSQQSTHSLVVHTEHIKTDAIMNKLTTWSSVERGWMMLYLWMYLVLNLEHVRIQP